MKATKYTVTVKIEVLSIDSVPSMLKKVSDEIHSEYPNGTVTADDGDSAKWNTKTEEVEF